MFITLNTDIFFFKFFLSYTACVLFFYINGCLLYYTCSRFSKYLFHINVSSSVCGIVGCFGDVRSLCRSNLEDCSELSGVHVHVWYVSLNVCMYVCMWLLWLNADVLEPWRFIKEFCIDVAQLHSISIHLSSVFAASSYNVIRTPHNDAGTSHLYTYM